VAAVVYFMFVGFVVMVWVFASARFREEKQA
jgi:hypothetical protein